MPSSSEYRPTRRVEGKPRVIVTRRLLPETEARMSELFDVTLNAEDKPLSREQLVAALNAAHVLVPTVTDAIDAELIAQAGPQFGLIANFGAGTEHIDLAAARARKVIVTNTPGVFTDDTADMTIALIISVARRLNHGGRTLRAGKWEGWAPSTMLGHRLSGKTLGIVGMGRIGQAVAHRARAFGLNVAYFSRHRLPEAFETMLGATYVDDLDNLVAAADILTLHCPASPETLHMIDARRIALMKPDAYLVNTARGQLVDEEALIDALVAGRIGGAGLDVFEHEPQVDPRLLAHPNVAIL
ncbi:MAG: D-glycerate dehydrogenase, partial [Novosphingobium sp.]